MKKSRLMIAGSAICLAMFSTTAVYAQDQDDAKAKAAEKTSDAKADGGEEMIVVTGSRIARPLNLDSTVPVTSVSAEEVIGRGELSLGDALSQLPSMRSTFTQANSTGSIGTAGLNLLDMRGLGTERTLVLVNGRRHVTAQPGNYNVDVNTIPRELLERVDTVTGGNSAIYGSDAVAGVVNFILRKDYEGISIRGQGGVTSYGDRGSYTASITAGKNFGGDRFNITGAFEYTKSNALFYADRDYLGALNLDGRGGVPAFITSQITTAPNRNFDGIPNTVFADGRPGVTFGNISLGGYVLTSCPADNGINAAQRAQVCSGSLTPTGGRINYNFAFAPDGTLVRDDPAHGLVDNRIIGGGVLGGLSATGVEDAMLLPGIQRFAGNLLFNADISPAFQPFVEAKFVHIDATQQSTQPTFIASTLSPTFSINNPFLTTQARNTLVSILNPGATTFSMQRFNNDFGTRAENHDRDTYRVVAGFRGDLGTGMNLRYEIAGNYGRTETYYETGGNVNLAAYSRAINAVAAPVGYTGTNFVTTPTGGRAVCAVNADAITTNDDPACYPLNVFGFQAPSRQALDYVLYTSSRKQWADQLNVQAYLSGDTGSFITLPGGPIGFALGAEYRRERAYSAYDEFTRNGNTFLNGAAPFAPPTLNIKEAFGEVRIPLLSDKPFFHELTLEGAGRVSDYGGTTGAVWAYNAGAIWAPIPDVRLRIGYAKSVRAPNLSNLYATPATTFANGLTDPCDQAGGTNAANNITANPNRVANCAAAGVPTTITYVDGSNTTVTIPWVNVPGSGVAGINRGNPDLVPEIGKSLTVGAILQPSFIPGLTISVDYYDIKVENVISGLTGQAIINRCYDDPNGINNVFCAAVARRTTAGIANATFDGQSSRRLQNAPDFVLPSGGSAFFNQPFNFAALKTAGVDADINYVNRLSEDTRINFRAIVSYLIKREQFTSITNPNFSTRLHGTLGDPIWAASLTAGAEFKDFSFNYNLRIVGKQVVSGLAWETFFPHQGRQPTNPDARPFAYYAPQFYHNFRAGFNVNEEFEFYLGVDNAFNKLPPYELAGVGADAIYPNTGRFMYAGFQAKF